MEKVIFWQDKEKRIADPTIYSKTAEDMAKEMKADHDVSRNKMNKRTQIRKFYDEVLRLEMKSRQIDMSTDEGLKKWGDLLPLVHMLTAKAAYARGRNLVSDNFVNFIKSSIKQVNDPRDLSVFAGFFEAFMGFYRLYGPSS